MKITEMLLDSAKYPFSGIKQLLILGLMILISTAIVGDYNEFYTFLQNDYGEYAVLLVLLLFFSIFAIFSILEAGYAFKIIEKSVLMEKKPPALNNFRSIFSHGIKEIIIAVIYFVIPVIILLVFLDDAINEINLGLPALSEEVALILIIGAFILGFFADMLFKVAIPHMASKGGAFKEAFNFPQILKKIRLIGLKKLLIGYIIVILGVVVVGGPVLKELIGSANIYGFFVAEEFIAPFLIMFAARFTALLYMESVETN